MNAAQFLETSASAEFSEAYLGKGRSLIYISPMGATVQVAGLNGFSHR
jgi:hypothetical protein